MVVVNPVAILALILLAGIVTGFMLGAKWLKGWVSSGVWAAGLLMLFMALVLMYMNTRVFGIELRQPSSRPETLPVRAEFLAAQPEAILALPGEKEILAQTPQPSPGLADPIPARSESAGPVLDQPFLAPLIETKAASSLVSAPASTPKGEAQALDTSEVWRLVIPSLQVDAVVKYFPLQDGIWDINGLKDHVAWLGGTSGPGLGSNTVLAGHIMVRNIGRGPFRFLDRLKPGETVVVYTEQNVYTYRVREQVLVDEDDVSVAGATDHAQITLLTCSNWDEENENYLKRRAVFADLVKTSPYVEEYDDALMK